MASDFLPMPAILFALNCVSLVLSILLFAFSLLTYGLLSELITAGCAIATILYQATILVLAFRRKYRMPLDPQSGARNRETYTTGSIAWVYVILTMWTMVFWLVVQTTAAGPGSIKPSETSTSWNFAIQIADAVITGFQMIVMGVLALHCTLAKRRIDKEERRVSDERIFDFSRSNTLRMKRKSSFGTTVVPPGPAHLAREKSLSESTLGP